MTERTKCALISVFNKSGIIPFALGLHELGWEILSSGGTAKMIAKWGIPVRDVATLPGGFKAMLGHRVVTLTPGVHGGLLAEDTPEHQAELDAHGIPRIDLVCVDMYPLEQEIAREGSTLTSVIEKTDIGGPTMLRSGAKGGRIVICDAADRTLVLDWLKNNRPDEKVFVQHLAAKSEFTVASYVLASARYLSNGAYDGFLGTRTRVLYYGENRRQTYAALYEGKESIHDPFALSKFAQIEGGDPSFINSTDLHRLVETATRTGAALERLNGEVPLMGFAAKHGNCCGAAIGSDPLTVIRSMVAGDHDAISGGVALLNFELDAVGAQLLRSHKMPSGKRVIDGVIAPGFTDGAIDELERKTGKCRLFVNPALAGNGLGAQSLDTTRRFRQVRGGFLVQDGDPYILELEESWKQELSREDQDNLLLAWGVGATSNSNTIALVKNGMLIGAGVNQRSRVMAGKLALLYASTYGHAVDGAIGYSDSFYPFPDGLEVLANAGVKKIFSTSGSINDKAVRARAEELGVRLFQKPDEEARGFYGH